MGEPAPEREEARGELAELAEPHKGAERHGEYQGHGGAERREPHQRRAGAAPAVGRCDDKAARQAERQRDGVERRRLMTSSHTGRASPNPATMRGRAKPN